MKECLVKTTLFVIVMALSVSLQAQSNADAMEKIKGFIGNIVSYKDYYPQEKVYLHLDNNGYLPDETIWFKAYVFKASTLLPTNLSKVLYVELLNPQGEVVERKILPIENGRTFGEFELDPIRCYSGYYEIRAYTRAMLNWDDAYIYSRVIPVFQMPTDTLNTSALEIGDVIYDQRIPLNRKEPVPLLASNSQKDNGVIATFFPEGGNIVKGLASRVAFKVTDKNGKPISATLKACAPDGKEFCSASTVHEGMGILSLPSDWQGGYALVQKQDGKEAKVNLPEAIDEGCALQTQTNAEGLDISIKASQKYQNTLLGVSVTCRSTACYFDTISIKSNDATHRTVPLKQLKDGVVQVTLFTPEGEVLAERLAWSEPKQALPQMVIRQNQASYEPCTPVVLDINLKDAEGNPLQSDFSISVKDAQSEVAASGADLAVDMLLSSELKGYIHNPEYYFASSDAEHRQALDLLLMVQGWRRYKWREMAGVEPLEITQPVERSLMIDGKAIAPQNEKKFRASDIDITFLMNINGVLKPMSLKPENTGDFALSLPDFYGKASTALVTSVKDQNKDVRVVLNRNFSPHAKPFEPYAMQFDAPKKNSWPSDENLKPSDADDKATKISEPLTFEWQDTIKVKRRLGGDINLQEVTITGKKDKEKGARFAWNGGMAAALNTARHYYDASAELDRYCDNGEQTPSLWSWLAERDPYFDYELSFYDEQALMEEKRKLGERGIRALDDKDLCMMALMKTMRYKGKPAIVLQDNDVPQENVTTFLLDDVKSIVTTEDEDFIRNIVPDRLIVEGYLNSPFSAVLLYTNPKGSAPYSKGMRKLDIHGYSYCQDFYSPDYRGADYADPEDHRRTLYWNPSLTTDAQGKASVILYSNARENMRLNINAQGIAVNGQMFGYK